MATGKRKNSVTRSEKERLEAEEWRRNEERKNAIRYAHRAGAPTRQYEIGVYVQYGGWEKSVIIDKFENGLYYEVRSEGEWHDYRRKEAKCVQCTFVPWAKLLPLRKGDSNFTTNEDIRLSYSNSTIEALLNKHLLSGVDFEPEYQRDFVWTDADRQALLDSVFMGADIGRFVFRVKDDDEIDLEQEIYYEIVDGKQRMLTLLDFYTGRYTYRGVHYHELSPRDRRRFDDASVSIADVRHLDKAGTLRLFLMLNRGGWPVSDDVIQNARKTLEQLETEEVGDDKS